MLPALRPATKTIVEDTPLLVLPRLAALIGSDDAMLLQQIHYWLSLGGHERDGRRWIYNSYEEWTAQFPFWSKHKVRRVVERLRRRGLVQTGRYNHHAYDQTTWYTIDYDAVAALGLPMPLPPVDPPDPPATHPPVAHPPAPPVVPAVPASVPGTPDVVCAGAAAPPPSVAARFIAPAAPPPCHAERGEEAPRPRPAPRCAPACGMAPATGSAAATSGGAGAPGRRVAATWGSATATSGGTGAPRGVAGAPTIPETTPETTSEINTRERERDGAPPPPAYETLTMTETLTGWLAAEAATLGVPLSGVNARHETDKWRDEIRAGRRAVPADAAADWRQWMRRALAYCRRHQPTGPTTHVPISLASGPAPADHDDLAARKAAAAQLRERLLARLARPAAGGDGTPALCPV